MLITREMVLQQDIGLGGTLFGGDMMARMDKASGIFAGLVSRNGRYVTRKVSELIFHSPVRPGEMIEFHGRLGRQGRTSLAVELDVSVFNPVTEARREVTSGTFVMVAIDDAGTPEAIAWKPEMVALAG